MKKTANLFGINNGHWQAVVAVAVLMFAAQPAALADEEALKARISRLERALNNKGLLDLVRQIELLNEEVRQLRGELENQVFALEQVRKSQRESYVDVDQRLGALETGGNALNAPATVIAMTPNDVVSGAMTDPPLPTLNSPDQQRIAGTPSDQAVRLEAPSTPRVVTNIPAAPELPTANNNVAIVEPQLITPQDGVPVVTPQAVTPNAAVVPVRTMPSGGPTVDSAESEAAYREAFGLLKAGQYEDSIAAFTTFQQQYPQSQYADNAQYWLGEAHYVLRQFEPAIGQYQQLISGFPESKKQSHAMLKIAYSYYELGMTDQSTGVLNDLKQRFPGSAAARLADERLQRIRAERP